MTQKSLKIAPKMTQKWPKNDPKIALKMTKKQPKNDQKNIPKKTQEGPINDPKNGNDMPPNMAPKLAKKWPRK